MKRIERVSRNQKEQENVEGGRGEVEGTESKIKINLKKACNHFSLCSIMAKTKEELVGCELDVELDDWQEGAARVTASICR